MTQWESGRFSLEKIRFEPMIGTCDMHFLVTYIWESEVTTLLAYCEEKHREHAKEVKVTTFDSCIEP